MDIGSLFVTIFSSTTSYRHIVSFSSLLPQLASTPISPSTHIEGTLSESLSKGELQEMKGKSVLEIDVMKAQLAHVNQDTRLNFSYPDLSTPAN